MNDAAETQVSQNQVRDEHQETPKNHTDVTVMHDDKTVRALQMMANCFPNEAVFAVDKNRRIVLWNEGAEKLLGFRADEVVGQSCLQANRCVNCMRGCGVEEYHTLNQIPLGLYRHDGSEVRVRKTARRIDDENGDFAGTVEVLQIDDEAMRAAKKQQEISQVDALHGTDRFEIELSTSRIGVGKVAGVTGTVSEIVNFHGLITRNDTMKALFATVKNVARTDVTVLVRGESGSGKELLAQAIHNESPRQKKPFLALNCAAVSPLLLESELFGHERGAFTGAVQAHQGVFERADGGTLFLDEVAELPLELQAKLLRVLEERTFFRVGGSKPIKVDVRILSATHKSLRHEVDAGKFRADLMFRLRVVPLFLPPLRERREDIPVLVQHFIQQSNEKNSYRQEPIRGADADFTRALLAYPWPGNIRELRNSIECAFAVSTQSQLSVEDLLPEIRAVLSPSLVPVSGVAQALVAEESAKLPSPRRWRSKPAPKEIELIKQAIESADGNLSDAAKQLGMSRPTLWRKRKKLGLEL